MSFFDETRTYLIIFIMFGLWSYWPNNKYKFLIKAYAFASIVIVFFTLFSVIYFNQFYPFTTLSNIVANFLYMLGLLTELVIAFESVYKRELQEQLFRKFSIVDRLFETKLRIRFPYTVERCELFIRNFILVSIVIVGKTSIACYLYYRSEWFNFLYPSMYLCWIIQARSIQMIFFVYLLRTRLHLIGVELEKMEQIIRLELNENQITLKRRKTNPLNVLSTKVLFNDRILNLKIVYGKLFGICESINMSFGWSLLAILIQSFSDFTSDCYWGHVSLNDTGQILVNLCLLTPHVVVLGTLAFYCSSCSHHVSQNNNSNHQSIKKKYFVESLSRKESSSDSHRQRESIIIRSNSRVFATSTTSNILHFSKWIHQYKFRFIGIGKLLLKFQSNSQSY